MANQRNLQADFANKLKAFQKKHPNVPAYRLKMAGDYWASKIKCDQIHSAYRKFLARNGMFREEYKGNMLAQRQRLEKQLCEARVAMSKNKQEESLACAVMRKAYTPPKPSYDMRLQAYA